MSSEGVGPPPSRRTPNTLGYRVAVLRDRTAERKLDPTAGIDARRGFLVNSKYEARAM
jgi:hypothetical protein